MRYDLLPHHSDIRLHSSGVASQKETLIGDLVPIDGESAEEETDDYCGDNGEALEEALPQITDTFSVALVDEAPSTTTFTRSGRRSTKTSRAIDDHSPSPDLLAPENRRRTAEETKRGGGAVVSVAPSKTKTAVTTTTTMTTRKKNGNKRDRRRPRAKEPMSRCDTCGKLFFSQFNMLRHVENVHLRILPYVCKFCNRGFPQKNSMQKHIQLIHNNNNNNNNNGTNNISKKDKKSGKREIKSEGLHPVYQMTEDQFE